MLCILSANSDIFFNLAAEEFLLMHSKKDICMLWQSDESVVVGKHQNAMAEVNYLWTFKNNIPVARRLTGGGTVYHGPGNLNFTFIRNGETGKLVDFKRFVTPIINYLHSLGILAEAGSRNDILVNGLKISGNAEHVYKTRVLHHGTLLFNADLDKLKESIKVNKQNFRDRAVQSVRSQVTNIKDLLPMEMTINEFESGLFNYLQHYYNLFERYELIPSEINEINGLRSDKYLTNNWIYGYSSSFEFSKTIRWQGNPVKIQMKIIKGHISQIHLEHDPENTMWLEIKKQLTDCEYSFPAIQNRLKRIISNKDENQLLSEMFF